MRRKQTLKAYKYRIYPTDAQVAFFAKTFGCCRFVWNKMLDKKLQDYKKKERIPQDTPAKYKDKFPFLKEVDSFALCNVQLQLEKAFKDHYFVGLGRPEVTPVEQALVDERSPNGLLKKSSCNEA